MTEEPDLLRDCSEKSRGSKMTADVGYCGTV